MFPGAKMSDAQTERTSSVDEMRNVIQHARRELARKIWDFFDSIDKLEEKEFMEVVSELDNDGVKISQLVEKFKKYKAIE